MKYRITVDVFCDEREHGHAFAERIVELIDTAFDEWPERKIGVNTHTAFHDTPDINAGIVKEV